MSESIFWKEMERRVRADAEAYQKQRYGQSATADELRQGINAVMQPQVSVEQPMPKGLEPTDKNAEKIASDYAAGILARPSSSWTPEEKAFIRANISAYQGGK